MALKQQSHVTCAERGAVSSTTRRVASHCPFQHPGQLPQNARVRFRLKARTARKYTENTATSVTGGEDERMGWAYLEKTRSPAIGLLNPHRGGSPVLRVQYVNWQT